MSPHLKSGVFSTFLLLALAGSGLLPARPGPRPLALAWWYWHHPFRLRRDEAGALSPSACRRLYVHAATVVLEGRRLELTSRQRWETGAPCEVWAVLRVHPRAIGALLSPAGPARAAALLRRAGLPAAVRGVQWDADVPTSRLRDYARFLRAFRTELPCGLGLSATALPDWLRSRDYPALLETAGELVPQFYGNRWPDGGQRPPPLWETGSMLAALRLPSGGAGASTWIGLPAYARCIVMDPAERPAGVRHDLDPEALLDDPAWQVTAAVTRADRLDEGHRAVPAEDTLALSCETSSAAGPLDTPAGTTLWFQWPRPEGLRAAMTAIAASPPPGLEGICFFRWPAPGESFGVLPATLDDPQQLSVSAWSRPLPWRARGDTRSPTHSPAARLRVSAAAGPGGVSILVKNDAADAPLLDNGITLEVFPAGGEVDAGGPVRWQRGQALASPLRADRAVLYRPFLRPGRTWEACRIRHPRGPVAAVARWKDGGGWRSSEVRVDHAQ